MRYLNMTYLYIYIFSLSYIIRDWGSKLKNRQVRLSDAGSYTCVANNSVGTDRIQAFLVVNGMFTLIMLSYLPRSIKLPVENFL